MSVWQDREPSPFSESSTAGETFVVDMFWDDQSLRIRQTDFVVFVHPWQSPFVGAEKLCVLRFRPEIYYCCKNLSWNFSIRLFTWICCDRLPKSNRSVCKKTDRANADCLCWLSSLMTDALWIGRTWSLCPVVKFANLCISVWVNHLGETRSKIYFLCARSDRYFGAAAEIFESFVILQ